MYLYSVLLLLLLCVCCYTAVIAAADVSVRHLVPDGKNCCWLIESDSMQYFLSLHSDPFCCCTPSQYYGIYGLDLPIPHPR